MAWTVAGRSKPLSSGRFAGAELLLLSEEVTDDSGKVFDFDTDVLGNAPSATCCEVLWLYIEYTAEAGGGSRQVFAQIRDAEADTVGGLPLESTIAASQTNLQMVAGLLEQQAALTPDHERLPLDLILFPGMDINMGDLNAQNSNDDLIVHVMIAVYP
jgi:hypothetical protein